MIDIEVCVSSDDLNALAKQLEAITLAGAKRVELCSHMQHDGLTPSIEAIKLARSSLTSAQSLMVMIRPRAGGFYYQAQEQQQMRNSILHAAEHGANAVVLGLLEKSENTLDLDAMAELIVLAKSKKLAVTCHRAFDALVDPIRGLKQLKTLGVERVLTAGSKWGTLCKAEDNIQMFKEYLQTATSDIEIVVAGGITPFNAAVIANALDTNTTSSSQCFSLHTYSGVLTDGLADQVKITQLIHAVNGRTPH